MKPREFDDLVRQKFDQDDFAYNPANWDKLAEQLDGRAKKRNLFMWWMPLVGMAASVAFAIGVPSVLRDNNTMLRNAHGLYAGVATNDITTATGTDHAQLSTGSTTPLPSSRNKTAAEQKDHSKWFAIRMENALAGLPKAHSHHELDLNNFAEPVAENNEEAEKRKKNKLAITKPGVHTFKEEDNRKPAQNAIMVLGGVNYGGQSTGYLVGASARHMVNDKLFVEGDVAFIGTTNTQQTEYMSATQASNHLISTARMVNSKNTNVEAKPTVAVNQGVIKTESESYNLYYAQITPSLGYKLMKRMSVGLGPDFQQMLVDNRPAPSDVDRGTLKEVPTFDVGFMGKTEYAVTRNIKAAVYYREGINNIITPTGKYIDRNYVQFQVKCAIFNK